MTCRKGSTCTRCLCPRNGTTSSFGIPRTLTFLANLFGPNSFLAAAGLAGAGAVLFQLGRPRVERYCKPKIERLRIYDAVAGPLVHAKVYVIDDEAVVGSTNFTVTGLRHNVEGLAFLNGKGLADCIVLKIASLNGEGIEIPFERAITG